MNLINEEITHNVFGEGNIVEHEDSFITVDFNKDRKRFVYPDALENFITLTDRDMAKSLEKVFKERKAQEKVLEKQRQAEKEIQMREQQRKELLKNHKIHESSQIVFWLDDDRRSEVFEDWKVTTGSIQSGKNKGLPNPVTRLRPNSAGVLTVRSSDQQETERIILGLFMVDEMFAGSIGEDGLVPCHAEYKIRLTDEEAEKMLFWNYYKNKNYPERTAWNSGTFRYFDNSWTAQIIKDIIALKTDEQEIEEAKKFLDYFCRMNAIDGENIPEPEGALKSN